MFGDRTLKNGDGSDTESYGYPSPFNATGVLIQRGEGKPGMVAFVHHPSTWEVEAEEERDTCKQGHGLTIGFSNKFLG